MWCQWSELLPWCRWAENLLSALEFFFGWSGATDVDGAWYPYLFSASFMCISRKHFCETCGEGTINNTLWMMYASIRTTLNTPTHHIHNLAVHKKVKLYITMHLLMLLLLYDWMKPIDPLFDSWYLFCVEKAYTGFRYPESKHIVECLPVKMWTFPNKWQCLGFVKQIYNWKIPDKMF